MSYSYQEQRPNLFTESGVKLLRAVEEEVNRLLTAAGAFQECHVRPDVGAYDSWDLMACLDYLIEQNKLVRLERRSWAQFNVYTSPKTSNR